MSQKIFSEEKVARYKRVFDLLDRDHNGFLEGKELLAASRVLGYKLPKQAIKNMMKHFDVDENGVLSFDEFLQGMPGGREATVEDQRRTEYRKKFQEYDLDGNGFISNREAAHVLARELGFTPDKSGALLLQFDVNEDGHLGYEEFVAFYVKVKELKASLADAFAQFDLGGKGYVTIDDTKRILSGMAFTDYEVESLFRTHDRNQDGFLEYEEFMTFWNA